MLALLSEMYPWDTVRDFCCVIAQVGGLRRRYKRAGTPVAESHMNESDQRVRVDYRATSHGMWIA
ncbi:MAG: hypothetical protein ABSD31_17890 [Candidatus Binataceae bacterium]|jgi:hypothetical protein